MKRAFGDITNSRNGLLGASTIVLSCFATIYLIKKGAQYYR